MSYQLPDFLTFLTSIASSDDDGDLHMNTSYRDFSDDLLLGPLGKPYLLNPEECAPRKSKFQRTVDELLKEYNPGLLASTYLPFTSVLKIPSDQSTLKVATEWLSVCTIIAEQTLRPERIIDSGDIPRISPSVATSAEEGLSENVSHEFWESVVSPLAEHSYSSERDIRDSIQEILKASSHPLAKPQHAPSQQPFNRVTEYIDWRVALSGHRVLFGLFLPSKKHDQFRRSLELVLEIVACVTDVFAYNIHQAWHSKYGGDRAHLNLISFLRAGDPEMTLQGAINASGEMIRQRIMQLKNELEALKNPSRGNGSSNETGGILSSIFPSFFSIPSSSSSQNNIDTTVNTDDDLNIDSEIQRTLWNWVTGTIHWAYEVEYFAPDFELDGEQHQSGGRRKKGGEIRDYGWVFLIKGEDVGVL